jgi:TatD DNase family protein
MSNSERLTGLVDSHCHLNFLEDTNAAISRAHAAGVEQMLCIGVEESSLHQVLSVAQANPGIWATAGLHPESAADLDPEQHNLDWLAQGLKQAKVVAVGEMGLDYAQQPDVQTKRWQQHWFAAQLDMAMTADLPVVVHTRDARQDTLGLLQRSGVTRGVLHCFTEDWAMAEVALELGFYISISGIVTFKNAANVQAVAERVPLERLLIETDAPWLAPTPHRGKTNEPALLPHTARFIANLRGTELQTLVAATQANFFNLFSRARA